MKGKVQIGEEPSLKYYPFLLSKYLHFFEIAVYLWLGTIGDSTELQLAFRNEITWNNIFQATNPGLKIIFPASSVNL